MKKSNAFKVAILCLVITTASYAQLTTTTMKLIRGSSHINFTAATGGVSALYTWPAAPGSTMPMQSDNAGVLTFAAIDMANQVTGVLSVANGGTGSSASLTGGNIMVSSGSGTMVEGAIGTAHDLLHGDLTWGAIALGSADVSGTLPVAKGGTGATTLTQDGILLGNGTGAVSAVALASDKVLVGTGSAPTARGFVAGNGIGVAIDASNITISSTALGSSSAHGQVSYVSLANATPTLATIVPGTAVAATSQIFLTVTDNTTNNLIAAGVTTRTDGIAGVGSFTVSISTDVDCDINWLIINP